MACPGGKELEDFFRSSDRFQRSVASSPNVAFVEPETLKRSFSQLNKTFLEACVRNLKEVGKDSTLAPIVVDYLAHTIPLFGEVLLSTEDGEPVSFFLEVGALLHQVIESYYTVLFKLESQRGKSGLLALEPPPAPMDTDKALVPVRGSNGVPDPGSNPLLKLKAIGDSSLKKLAKIKEAGATGILDLETKAESKAELFSIPRQKTPNPSNGKVFGSVSNVSTKSTAMFSPGFFAPPKTLKSARPIVIPSAPVLKDLGGFGGAGDGPTQITTAVPYTSNFIFTQQPTTQSEQKKVPKPASPAVTPAVTSNGSIFGNLNWSSSSGTGLFGSRIGTSTTTAPSTGTGPSSGPTSKSDGGDDEDEASEKEAMNHEFVPVKEDDALYSIRSKVFAWNNKKSTYEVRGLGELHIRQLEDKNYQLIVRADNVLGNVLLNMKLDPQIPMSLEKNNVKTVDPHTTPPTPILIRVKSPAEAQTLLDKINELKTKN